MVEVSAVTWHTNTQRKQRTRQWRLGGRKASFVCVCVCVWKGKQRKDGFDDRTFFVSKKIDQLVKNVIRKSLCGFIYENKLQRSQKHHSF